MSWAATRCLVLALGLGAPGSASEDLAATCDALAARHELSGVVLVARGDEVLVERAYGLADVEAEEPVHAGTRFLVASLTKPIVAFATLRLVEAGVLGLEDPVLEHVADLAGSPAGGATVYQLLTHTSGLPHYEAWPGFLDDVRRERSESELLALLAETELRSAPGSELHYSGPGYLLLGIVLERATGEPLPEVLDRWVFEPLGMERSELLGAEGPEEPFARPYEREDGALVPAPLRHPSTLGATGGLVTTAGDLHRFARAVQRGELLGAELRETHLRGARGPYACGLIVYRHPFNGERFARHQGRMDGVAAHFVFGLDDERVAVALSNVGGTPVNEIDDRLILAVPPRPAEEARGGGR